MKRYAAVLIIAMLGLLWLPISASAQYPAKPVRIVVPYPAGGAVDNFARVLAQGLTELWKQQVVIENRGGASTMVGADQVAKSPPDGYTLLLSADLTFVIVPHLFAQVPYDVTRDFAPVSALVSATQALVANPSLPVKTTADLIALAKAKPGELTYGSFGVGSTGHLNVELLQQMTGARFNHIPYPGAGPAMTDVIGGHIQFMLAALSIVKGNVEGGKLHMIGVGSDHRSAQYPDVPTISESGVPGYEAKSWFGLVAPARTPPEVIDKINADVARVLADPAFVQKSLVTQGLEPIAGSPKQFKDFIESETVKWGKIIKDANIKVQQ